MSRTPQESLEDAGDFAARVDGLSGANLGGCLQCAKCTSGCPVAGPDDIQPHERVRLVQLGMKDEVLSCRSIWMCVSCQTCVSRCPQNVVGLSQVREDPGDAVVSGRGVSVRS